MVVLTNSNSSGSQGTAVTKHSILVYSNIAQITELLDLVAWKNTINKLEFH